MNTKELYKTFICQGSEDRDPMRFRKLIRDKLGFETQILPGGAIVELDHFLSARESTHFKEIAKETGYTLKEIKNY